MKKDVKKIQAVLRRADILKIMESNTEEFTRLSVRRIGLFGSYAEKGGHAASDMDFLVKFDAPTFDNYMELKFFLERLFRKKIDLVMEEMLKPALKYVKKEAVYVKVA